LKARRLGVATKYLKKGLEIFRHVGDKYKVAEALGLLSDLYFLQDKTEQGIEAIEEAIHISEQIQARAQLANLHRKLADIYTKIDFQHSRQQS